MSMSPTPPIHSLSCVHSHRGTVVSLMRQTSRLGRLWVLCAALQVLLLTHDSFPGSGHLWLALASNWDEKWDELRAFSASNLSKALFTSLATLRPKMLTHINRWCSPDSHHIKLLYWLQFTCYNQRMIPIVRSAAYNKLPPQSHGNWTKRC